MMNALCLSWDAFLLTVYFLIFLKDSDCQDEWNDVHTGRCAVKEDRADANDFQNRRAI